MQPLEKVKSILRRIGRWSLWALVMLVFTLLLAELCFRWQVVDFYHREWTLLNEGVQRKPVRVLVMGDSFTASPDGWVKTLRDSLPEVAVYNAAIPGTGLFQAVAIARRRFRQAQPRLLVYQVYAGNDLFDLRYPAGGASGLGRKIYWSMANRLRILNYINYRWGQSLGQPQFADLKNAAASAPADAYNEREKTLLRAEPGLYRDQVMLSGDRAADFDYFISKMESLISYASDSCKVLVVFIPHCAQVSPMHYEKIKAIGAELWPAFEEGSSRFPFYEKTAAHFEGREGVRILSALPILRDHPQRDSLYYWLDPHLNPQGQQVLGKWMTAEIRRELKP